MAGSAFSFLDPVGLRLPALGTIIILHGVLAEWRRVSQPIQHRPRSSEMLHCRSDHREGCAPQSQQLVIPETPSHGEDKIWTKLPLHRWSRRRQNYVNCHKSQDMDSEPGTSPFDFTSIADKVHHRTPKAANKNRYMVI